MRPVTSAVVQANAKGVLLADGVTAVLARAFGPEVRVNAVAPSLTRTPMADRAAGDERIQAGDIVVDRRTRRVLVRERLVSLSARAPNGPTTTR